MMQRLLLNGEWQLAYDDGLISATVPGCVHTDLYQNELLSDPFFRDHEKDQFWIGERDWHYQRVFVVDESLLSQARVLLVCHGLDTLATVSINGVEIAKTDNMYRTYEWDVKSYLQVGNNQIDITFDSPLAYVRMKRETGGSLDSWGVPPAHHISDIGWIRKEPCNFGWDWGPKLITSGIWRDIELIGFSEGRLSDVLILQAHNAGQVDLTVHVQAEQISDMVKARVKVSFDGEVLYQSDELTLQDGSVSVDYRVQNPALWWITGLGEQPLYDIDVELLNERQVVDRVHKRIGLRVLKLERHPEDKGESFYFSCNGVPFFSKGANWIPLTPYPHVVDEAQYRKLIQAAEDANMNMLRVWGGGIYEPDIFYDLCDEYGIAVWQDFMFACSTYPSFDDDFMATVEAEARDNVRRIRHHASLALWCGNNEVEQGMSDSLWTLSMSWENYAKLFDDLLGGIVKALDPQRDYWPGSPHTPIVRREDWMNPHYGDTHLWYVWHQKEPFEWYRTRPDRFISEFGFQSFPPMETISEFALTEDCNITSYVMEYHQRSGIGNNTIIHYMMDWFRLPSSFESTVLLSQILQGMAMKYAVEHWRRNMPYTMGTLYWQFNDVWPAPTWSSLDWHGNWKALHFIAKRFYAPLLISGLEDVETGTLQIHITSDLQQEQSAIVEWNVTDVETGEQLNIRDAQSVVIAPNSSQLIHTIDLTDVLEQYTARNVIVWLRLVVDGQVVSWNTAFFSRPKHLMLSQPRFETRYEAIDGQTFNITVTSSHPALYVHFKLPDIKGAVFSDNYMDLGAGESVTVQLSLSEPMAISQLQDHLVVSTLSFMS
jgi:beta-mannosidase